LFYGNLLGFLGTADNNKSGRAICTRNIRGTFHWTP